MKPIRDLTTKEQKQFQTNETNADRSSIERSQVKNAATKGLFGELAVMSRRNLWAACSGTKNAGPACDHGAGSEKENSGYHGRGWLGGRRFRFGEPSDIVAQLSKLMAWRTNHRPGRTAGAHRRLSLRESCATFAERKATLSLRSCPRVLPNTRSKKTSASKVTRSPPSSTCIKETIHVTGGMAFCS